MTIARILTVAGSDSGGGAGIEADLKTVERLGGYGMAAITAITAQNTQGVFGIWSLAQGAVERQITAVVTDIGIDAVKCGMLGSACTVLEVASTLSQLPSLTLVVDPVMVAKGGERLLAEDAQAVLRDQLIPMATVVTPNLPEAQTLAGRSVATRLDREEAARRIYELGAKAVLIKGGHGEEETVEDLLFDGTTFTAFRSERIATLHTHGTGCTLSAGIATGLGQGLDLYHAIERAIRYVHEAIRTAPELGRGRGPLNHAVDQTPWT